MVAGEGDGEALEALMPLLHDADWRVRKTALLATGNVAQRGCVLCVCLCVCVCVCVCPLR